MGEKFQHPEFQEIQGNMDACKGAISRNRTIPYMRGSGPLPPFGGGRGPELAEGHKGRRRLCRPVSDRLTLALLGALTGRQSPGTACGPGTLASAGLRPRGHGNLNRAASRPAPAQGMSNRFQIRPAQSPDHQGSAAFPFADFSLTLLKRAL